MNLQNSSFVTSCAAPDKFISDGLAQIAFAGRSNVGKSSVINRLLGRRALAKVGAAPGKTIHINYFSIDGALYFVDLPGYGYAKVNQAEKARWAALIEKYFASGLITAGVQIVDARHEPTANDITMSNWFKDSECPYIVIANKLDKLKKSEIQPNMDAIRRVLELPEDVPVIPFSAEKGDGKDEALRQILATVK